MYTYSTSQWLLFFFFYCFLGWLWECSFVSVQQGLKTGKWQWVNRGFLHGPFLPIYGFACVGLLFVTIPIKEELWAVYLVGMLFITALELLTGLVMEKMFGVKYWDYHEYPLNFRGYISLFSSLFWGICAVLIVTFIHTPVEILVGYLPRIVVEILALVLLAINAYDVSESVREALDMKELLQQLTESRENLKDLERRLDAYVDAVVAFTPIPDIEELREKRLNWKQEMLFKLDQYRQQRVERLLILKQRLSELDFFEERENLLEQIEHQLGQIREHHNKEFLHAVHILKRNPGLYSQKYQDSLEELRQIYKGDK